jgi:hypothetical protein
MSHLRLAQSAFNMRLRGGLQRTVPHQSLTGTVRVGGLAAVSRATEQMSVAQHPDPVRKESMKGECEGHVVGNIAALFIADPN